MTRVLATGLLACALLAGCGGATTRTTTTRAAVPPLPRSLALQLADQAEGVAAAADAGDLCGALREAQALRASTITAINDGLVPDEYHEALLARVQNIEAAQSCPEPPVENTDDDEPEGKGHKDDKKKDKHKGKND